MVKTMCLMNCLGLGENKPLVFGVPLSNVFSLIIVNFVFYFFPAKIKEYFIIINCITRTTLETCFCHSVLDSATYTVTRGLPMAGFTRPSIKISIYSSNVTVNSTCWVRSVKIQEEYVILSLESHSLNFSIVKDFTLSLEGQFEQCHNIQSLLSLELPNFSMSAL